MTEKMSYEAEARKLARYRGHPEDCPGCLDATAAILALVDKARQEQAEEIEKIVAEGHCNDTCSNMLSDEYPCDCWKAKLRALGRK